MSTINNKTPITIPAIAPPDNPGDPDSGAIDED